MRNAARDQSGAESAALRKKRRRSGPSQPGAERRYSTKNRKSVEVTATGIAFNDLGDRVRVTAQLIDAGTDEHLWSEVYERDLADIFAIQSEVAQAIVAQVQAEISPEEAAALADVQATSIEVYDLVTEGRNLISQGGGEGLGLEQRLVTTL